MTDYIVVKVTSWHRLPKHLFEGHPQREIAEWMPEEYPSLCGFVADFEPAKVKVEVRDLDNGLQNWQQMMTQWESGEVTDQQPAPHDGEVRARTPDNGDR